MNKMKHITTKVLFLALLLIVNVNIIDAKPYKYPHKYYGGEGYLTNGKRWYKVELKHPKDKNYEGVEVDKKLIIPCNYWHIVYVTDGKGYGCFNCTKRSADVDAFQHELYSTYGNLLIEAPYSKTTSQFIDKRKVGNMTVLEMGRYDKYDKSDWDYYVLDFTGSYIIKHGKLEETTICGDTLIWVRNNEMKVVGVLDANGKTLFATGLVDRIHDKPIINDGNNYQIFKVYKNGSVGLIKYKKVTKKFTQIVSTEEKYSDIRIYQNQDGYWSGFYNVSKDRKEGILDSQGKVIIPLIYSEIKYNDLLPNESSTNTALKIFSANKDGNRFLIDSEGNILTTSYESLYTININGIRYWKCQKDNKYGILHTDGKQLIAPEYQNIEYAGGNIYIRYKVNGYWGIMDLNGEIIVPTSRGYTSIGDYVSSQKTFSYTTANGRGEVDKTGNQVSFIPKEDPKPVEKQLSKTTTQTTSTSEKSDSSDDDGLLYKGMYSCDGQGYDTYSGQSFFSDLVAGNYEMTISENDLHWNFYTAFYKYTTKNGTRVYESNGLTEDVFYVSPSYNVYFTSTMSSWMGTNTWRYNLTKGQSTYSPQPYNGGGSYNNNNPSNSYNSSTSSPSSTPQKRWRNVTRTETCPSCHGSGKCNTCNGKGYFNNPYGTGTVSCSNCNHGRCRKCGGSGTIQKIEQVYE